MSGKIFGLGILFIGAAIQAQTNQAFILVTNMVAPGPYLRVLDGVTYNVAYSSKWKKFKDWEGFGGRDMPDLGRPGEVSHLVMAPCKVFPGVTFIQISREHSGRSEVFPNATYVTFLEPVRIVAVLHCTDAEHGGNFYCAQTTNYITRTGDMYRAYDCGVQSTNLVPVVKKQPKTLENKGENKS